MHMYKVDRGGEMVEDKELFHASIIFSTLHVKPCV